MAIGALCRAGPIAWSRVQVGDHTTAQVLAGVALGVVVNATVFQLLRERVSGSVAAAGSGRHRLAAVITVTCIGSD